MGLFDIFKTETKATTLEDLSCISINEWDDGYTDTDTLVIDFIKKKIESMSYEKFISFLKKRDKYLKVTDEELNNEEKYSMNKIKLKGEINSFFPYPRHFLNADPKMWESGIKSYRIIESRERYIPERAGGKGRETGNFKCLQILTIDNQMNKYPCDKSTRDLSIQFVDLDDDEHELIKPLDIKLKKFEDPKLYNSWLDMWNGIYKGIFTTKKRKKYPINRYQSYLAFEE